MLKKGYVEEGVQPRASLCDLQTTNTKIKWHPEPHSTSTIAELNERRRGRGGGGGDECNKGKKKFEISQNRSYMHLEEPNSAQ